LNQGQQTHADQRHLQERAIALQQETLGFLQQEQAVALERDVALQAGHHARESEVQAHLQAAQMSRQQADDRLELLCMQQEYAELQKERNALLQNLGVCQDVIREETQRHQQEHAQYVAHIQMLHNAANSQGRDEAIGAGNAMFRAAPASHDGMTPWPMWKSGAAEANNSELPSSYPKLDPHPDSARLLRAGDLEITKSKEEVPKESVRHLKGNEFGLGQPVGFAVGPTLTTNLREPLGGSDANLPRVHNLASERKPPVQARAHAEWNCEEEDPARVFVEHTRHRPRSSSPSHREHVRVVSSDNLRRKEQEKVEVPAYPEITKLMTWKTSLARAVMIAANSPDAREVMRWISQTWAEGQTFDALGEDEYHPFVTLDMKLAQGMMIMLNRAGEKASRIRDKVNLKAEEATRSGNLITGRQLVFMFLDSYKTFDRCDIVYGFDHLGNLKVKNHDLHEFHMTWNHIIDNMGKFAVDSLHLRDVFYRKIKR
jgi:hypothetical protein